MIVEEAIEMIGARRWFVAVVGLIVAILGVGALRMQRTFDSSWRVDSRQDGVETALLIDTRGGALVQTGDRGRGVPPWGDAGPGYIVRIAASSGRKSSLTVRLVSPSAETVWERALAERQRAHLEPTELAEAGVWRVEVSAPAQIGHVGLSGSFVESPWSRTPAGLALPITLIVGGLVVAVATWFGAAGTRVSALALAMLAISWPLALHGTYWVFQTSPAGVWILLLTIGLTASAGVALGWTHPHKDGPPPRRADVVMAILGAALAVPGFVAGADQFLCGYEVCHGLDADRMSGGLLAIAGLVLLGVAARRVGRRSAEPAMDSVRIVALDALGTALAILAVVVLGFGLFAAWFTAFGIGFSDQGPSSSAGSEILLATLGLTAALVFGSILSFRFDHARRRPGAR